MNYQQAWEFLDQLQFFKIKLGLDSMNRFLARLDNPHHELKYVHIGGTNGKGSVASTLTSILGAAGCKVGLYTSPHLSSVRERFRINDDYITQQDFTRLVSRIKAILGSSRITYFECTTTLALLWFAEQKVDIAILEVGMGGRLDATNVITPLLSIITNVSMDHEQYLGNTLRQVATEKAGIIKAGVPVISGAADDDTGSVIKQTCRTLKAPLYLYGRDFTGSRTDGQTELWDYQGLEQPPLTGLPMALQGRYQIGNASLAMAAVELLQQQGYGIGREHIRTGLAQASWPGRLESFSINRQDNGSDNGSATFHYLLDGAHNPAGVTALREALDDEYSYADLFLIWGAMVDKDLQTTLREIAPLAHTIIFTRPEAERSATTDQLLATLPGNMRQKAILTDSVQEALSRAEELATPEDLVCIAGSLYLVGAARLILRGELVADG